MSWKFELSRKKPTGETGSRSLYPILKLGCDPELFLITETGLVVAPDTLSRIPRSLAPDGAQLELHPSPSHCRGFVLDHLRAGLMDAKRLAIKHQLQLHIAPVIDINQENLAVFPPSALVAGCEPDFDAYTGDTSLRYCNFRKHLRRYGGGHLHAGHRFLIDNPHLPSIVALCDLVVGVWEVATTPVPKLEALRRRYYGRAGCFRPQPHGFEYRSLSNTWLRHPHQAFAVLGLFRDAIDMCILRPQQAACLWAEAGRHVQEIINEVDVEAARKLWTQHVEPAINGSSCGLTEVIAGYLQLALKHIAMNDASPSPTWKIDSKEIRGDETHGDFAGSLRNLVEYCEWLGK